MKIFMTVGFIFFLSKINATVCVIDTIPGKKPWKISQRQFADDYGKDDTARAIINYYFKKRNNARKDIIVSGVITAVSGLLFLLIGESNAAIVSFFAEGLFGTAFWTLIFTSVISLYRWLHFSRKKLWETLQNYFSGNPIPSSLNKRMYKKKKWFLK